MIFLVAEALKVQINFITVVVMEPNAGGSPTICATQLKIGDICWQVRVVSETLTGLHNQDSMVFINFFFMVCATLFLPASLIT